MGGLLHGRVRWAPDFVPVRRLSALADPRLGPDQGARHVDPGGDVVPLEGSRPLQHQRRLPTAAGVVDLAPVPLQGARCELEGWFSAAPE